MLPNSLKSDTIGAGESRAATGHIPYEGDMSETSILDNYTQAATGMEKLEAHMLSLPQVSCQIFHRFGVGIYIREIHIPAGAICVGHYQKYAQNNVFLKGRVLMMQEDGIVDMKAPMFYVGTEGRKVGLAIEDVVWQNIYVTDETDIEKLENMFLDKSDFASGFIEKDKIDKAISFQKDRDDFSSLLLEIGLTSEDVRRQSEINTDRIEMPIGSYPFKIGESSIEGKGVIATADIPAGTVIGMALLNGRRTPLGRFCNHSLSANAEYQVINGRDLILVSLKDISGCRGGIDGDEITVNYRDVLTLTNKMREERLCLQQ